MKEHSFSKEEIIYLKNYRKKAKKAFVYRNITIILMITDNRPYEDIAFIVGVDVKTVKRCFQNYLQKGIEGLEPKSKKELKNHSYLEKEQEEELKKHLDENLYPNAKAVKKYIYKEYGVKYSLSGVNGLLKRLGFSFKKVSVAPIKADENKQREFIEKYRQIRSFKPQALIYFADAVHFLHNMIASSAWILKGKTKVLPTNSGRKRINVIGVYEPKVKELISIDTLQPCNSQLVNELLTKIRLVHPQEEVILILDNAKYQHATIVKEKANEMNIHLEYLPSYSPNLNLIERLWKLMKKIIVRNQYIEKFSGFISKVKNFLSNYKKYESEIKSLITENFQLVYAS